MDSVTLAPLYLPSERFEISAAGFAEWQESESFKRLTAFYHDHQRALQSHIALALLHHLIVMHRPKLALEIGTYQAGTSEVLARALHEAGAGHLETIDPFNNEQPSLIAAMPLELQQRISFLPVNSGAYFDTALSQGKRYDFVLIDGNHEFEYARFDLECAARLIRPGGLVVLDNIEQPGPRLAAKHFLESHPEWEDVAGVVDKISSVGPLDEPPPAFCLTKFYILKAPSFYVIRNAALSFGNIATDTATVDGVEIYLAKKAVGTLHVQVYSRTFGIPTPEELQCRQQLDLTEDNEARICIPLSRPLRSAFAGDGLPRRIEIVLAFVGESDLALQAPPMPYPARQL